LKNFLKVFVIFFFSVPCVFAQEAVRQAVIQELVGTVEVKDSGSAAWEPAAVGRTVKQDTVISTGFRSIAVIAVGNTLVTVRPLSRLNLTELSHIQNTENIELNLTTGRIHAEVKPPPGGKTDFTVRSAAASASVRGTVFEFDTLNLTVVEGTVNFTGAVGVPVLVDAGRASFAGDSSGRAAPPEETSGTELQPQLPIATEVIPPPNQPKPVATGRGVELSVTATF